MKNFFAFTLIVVSTIVMASSVEAFQPPGREGGQRGGRGGPGGERGQRGGPGGERGGPRMEIPIIQALDADKDGEISSEEMANAATALATLDKNSDGVLQHDEMMPARPERGGRRGGPGGGGPGGGGQGGGEGDSNAFVDRMMQNDTDGDGKVSADEAPERMQGFFERLDGDKDGFLTKEEITEASNRWSGGGRGGRDGGGGGRDGGGQRPKRPGSE